MLRLLPIGLLLAACSGGPTPAPTAGEMSLDSPSDAQETIAPGAEGLYEGDPLAGPDMDPSDDPL